jgi:hypothetical protein
MKESYVFWPRTRILFDILLYFAGALVLLSAFRLVSWPMLAWSGGIAALIFTAFWFLWIKPVFKVIIAEGKISGPSPALKRRSFPLRKLDHRKILLRTRAQKLFGYRDLHGLDGSTIRLCHRLLGKLAVYEIMEIVEKYPFRESAEDGGEKKPGVDRRRKEEPQ